MSAMSAVLDLYFDPEQLVQRLPTLALLTRPAAEISDQAGRLRSVLAARFGDAATVDVVSCDSQIGSGALPTQRIPSAGLAIAPAQRRRGTGTALNRISSALRALPVPVIGRIQDGRLILDLRCLDDEDTFATQLAQLDYSSAPES
jgi:L-seryl-tRNA(Ser) seleniumtransferase